MAGGGSGLCSREVGSSLDCRVKWAPPRPAHSRLVRDWLSFLSPTVRLGPGANVHLFIPRVNLTKRLATASRLQRALLKLSPTESSSWDVTRPLQRQLGLGVSWAPSLRLPLQWPSDRLLTASPSAPVRLELHWRPHAGRGRRSAHARAQGDCPLGLGRCCRLQILRASLEDLGLTDWVLAPRELNLRMCSGACPSQFRPANMRAQMLARLHDLKPEVAPAPCCVPASYEPVVLMHRDSAGRVSLTPYDNLVAKDCHCV